MATEKKPCRICGKELVANFVHTHERRQHGVYGGASGRIHSDLRRQAQTPAEPSVVRSEARETPELIRVPETVPGSSNGRVEPSEFTIRVDESGVWLKIQPDELIRVLGMR